jgi:hypothetical protein
VSKGITIDLEGLNEVLSKVRDASDDIKSEVDNEIQDSTLKMVQNAKRLAPKNLGRLAGAIGQEKIKELEYEYSCGVEYAPYVEFGTKTYVRVPNGFEALAASARGGKGGAGSLFENIKKWLEKKNRGLKGKELDNRARFVSYIIAKKGIKPQPFFIPPYEFYKKELIKTIKTIVSEKR